MKFLLLNFNKNDDPSSEKGNTIGAETISLFSGIWLQIMQCLKYVNVSMKIFTISKLIQQKLSQCAQNSFRSPEPK